MATTPKYPPVKRTAAVQVNNAVPVEASRTVEQQYDDVLDQMTSCLDDGGMPEVDSASGQIGCDHSHLPPSVLEMEFETEPTIGPISDEQIAKDMAEEVARQKKLADQAAELNALLASPISAVVYSGCNAIADNPQACAGVAEIIDGVAGAAGGDAKDVKDANFGSIPKPYPTSF
ncbi:MAG: hypothetical protein ABIO70_24335 [Pseudomonadota bacterium]